MKTILETLVAGSLVALIFLAGIALVGGICLLPSLIGWLLWNHAAAPAFGLGHASFWLVFAVLWVFGLVARMLK